MAAMDGRAEGPSGSGAEQAELELAVLASLIHDRHLVTMALNQGFYPDTLHNPLAQRLCRVVLELYVTQGGVLDRVTLSAGLQERGLLTPEMEKTIGTVLMIRPPTAAQFMAYLEILKTRESRRRLEGMYYQMGRFLQHTGEERKKDVLQFTGEMIGQLFELQRRRMRKQIAPVSEMMSDLIYQTQHGGQDSRLGYSLAPFERLDNVLSGIRPGFYYGLAGAPRRGKTNLALQMGAYVAKNHRVPVLFYTWEQTSRVLAARLLAKELMVNPTHILSGTIAPDAALLAKLRSAEESVSQFSSHLYIIEAGRKDTLERIKAHAYNVMQEHGTESVFLIFDYLQKIPLEREIYDEKARTDYISSSLAEVSLELRAPVLAISPLDKEGCRIDERPGQEEQIDSGLYERPTMHHSVGSGDLEYDLDVAMVLAKDWKATIDLRRFMESRAAQSGVEAEALPKIDIINLFVDKNRDAPNPEAYIVQYAFLIAMNKYIELDYKSEKEYQSDFRGFPKMLETYDYLTQIGVVPKEPVKA